MSVQHGSHDSRGSCTRTHARTQALEEVINTEAQMQAAREDMDVDDAELLGKKKKAAGAAGGTAAGAEGSASTSGREMVNSCMLLCQSFLHGHVKLPNSKHLCSGCSMNDACFAPDVQSRGINLAKAMEW
eukprot:103241-Pelagomonas_calceolata.AAC.2